jgi:predicted O-methyltransferase YrrM
MYNSILSTVVRDDDRYLDEWVDYHLKLGFEHIVMYDHKSLIPVEARWGDKVTVIRKERDDVTFPDNFHNETLKNFQSNWIGLLDVDEFLISHHYSNINELLSKYEQYGGLSINWSVYGSSDHESRPEGLVKDNYVWRMPNDEPNGCQTHVKTILKSEYCKYIHNPHTCQSSRDIVTEDYEVCNSAFANSSRTLCRINHYITRSYEDWLYKINRAIRCNLPNLYNIQGFYDINKLCTVYDDILKDFGKPKLGDSIEGWFNFGNIYTDMVGKFNDAVFIEIGAWKGRSAVFMADKIRNARKNIKFYVIDIWEPFLQENKLEEGVAIEEFLKNIEPVRDYITPIKGSSHDVYKQFEDKSVDFIFLDANHSYEPTKKDIELWYSKIKDTGIFAGHDYTWSGVGRAVNEYADAHSLRVKIIPNTSCWIIEKK